MTSTQKVVLLILSTAPLGYSEEKPDKPDKPDSAGENRTQMVHLDQGWSPETQRVFRSTGQGSLLLPYAWFRFLEEADRSDLFRSKQNIERFRYISQDPAEWNPDGMPIGFVKSFDPRSKEQWVGLNCAGCHTAKIEYQGASLLIDGAPTLGDFQTFIHELESALKATLEDEEKYERFAKNVLSKDFSQQSAQDLKDKLSQVTLERSRGNQINVTKTRYGYGRLDAFGITFNNVAVDFLGVPENQIDPNAPASYPFIWGSLQSDYMQWVGSAPNTPVIGSILRATGEVWGTFGRLTMRPTATPGYASSAPFADISKLLDCVEGLRSPEWPEKVFPKIDRELAEAGKVHYTQHCATCHQVIARDQQPEKYKAVLVPYKEVGTDPAEIELVSNNVSKTGPLEGTPVAVLFGDNLGPTAKTATLLFNASLGAMLRHPEASMREALKTQMGAYVKARVNGQYYKARPLTGIWATAPYLHNGSLPNLYQILLPQEQRAKEFYVGNREFDPKHVGYVSSETAEGFRLDTRIPGNRNTGHDYGTEELTDEQRWALLEYLKTL